MQIGTCSKGRFISSMFSENTSICVPNFLTKGILYVIQEDKAAKNAQSYILPS